MRIGIDAKWYYSGPPSGVNVVRNIVNALIETNKQDYIVFFLSKKDIHMKNNFRDKISKNKKLTFFFVDNSINFLTNTIFFPFYLKKFNLDIMLFQNYIPIWGTKKIKCVDYVHDFLFFDYPQFFTKLERFIFGFMKYSVLKSDHVITISNSERKRILNNCNIKGDKVSFVYHGLDSMFYERIESVKATIKIKYELPQDFILYVGRLNVRKNIKSLLISLSELDRSIPLVIVGNLDNQGFDIQKIVNNLKIKDKVKFLGYVPDKDLAEIVASAKIFVFPSFAEGFGLPPLEAMKSGIPTIISNTTSLPEVCGDAALSFNPEKIYELTSLIKLLLNNRKIYEKYKVKGLNKSKEYTWDKSITQIMEILNKIVKN